MITVMIMMVMIIIITDHSPSGALQGQYKQIKTNIVKKKVFKGAHCLGSWFNLLKSIVCPVMALVHLCPGFHVGVSYYNNTSATSKLENATQGRGGNGG